MGKIWDNLNKVDKFRKFWRFRISDPKGIREDFYLIDIHIFHTISLSYNT